MLQSFKLATTTPGVSMATAERGTVQLQRPKMSVEAGLEAAESRNGVSPAAADSKLRQLRSPLAILYLSYCSMCLLCYTHAHKQVHTIILTHAQYPTFTNPNHNPTCFPTPTICVYLSVSHHRTPVCRTLTFLNMFLPSPPESSPPASLNRYPRSVTLSVVSLGGQGLCNVRAFRSPSLCREDQWGERK